MRVAVFGMGYVGTVTAAVLASNGHDVVGVDVDSSKVAGLTQGQSPVVEPGLSPMVAVAVAAGRLRATVSPQEALEDAEVSLVCVGTPSSPSGSTDLNYVVRAVSDVVDALRRTHVGGERHHTLVIRSTVPPGTLDRELQPIADELVDGSSVTLHLGSCPEFLREGSAISDFYESPLTVVGTDDPVVIDAMASLLAFLPGPIQIVPSNVAEGLKFACNAFHATKISFANEMGRWCRHLGVDSRMIMELLCLDTKLNVSPAYLNPGFAFGGSCLPKDLRSLLYIGRMNSLDLPLLSGVLSTNTLSVSEVVTRVIDSEVRTVAILGLSFKTGSDDLRESPFVDLAETLLGKGYEVRIFDPIIDSDLLIGANRSYVEAKLPHLRRVLAGDAERALAGADLALVSSSHPSVLQALRSSPPRAIFDLCGRLGPTIEALPGYQGVAW